MTRWRIRQPNDYTVYATICPRCGIRRGWPTERSARTALEGLAEHFNTREWIVEEYAPGVDATCRCDRDE